MFISLRSSIRGTAAQKTMAALAAPKSETRLRLVPLRCAPRQAHSDCNSANNGHLADLGWIVPGSGWVVGAAAMP